MLDIILFIYFYLAGGMKGADIAVGWVESSGKAFLQVQSIALVCQIHINRFVCCSTRIGMQPAIQDQFSIIQHKIGFCFKAMKKMDGPLSNVNVYSIHVIRWTFQ